MDQQGRNPNCQLVHVVSNVCSTQPDFHFEKTRKIDFLRHLACNEIIKPKLSMLMCTRQGTTIVLLTQQENISAALTAQTQNLLSLSFCRGSRVEGSRSRARVPCRGSRVTFFFFQIFFFLEKVTIDALKKIRRI